MLTMSRRTSGCGLSPQRTSPQKTSAQSASGQIASAQRASAQRASAQRASAQRTSLATSKAALAALALSAGFGCATTAEGTGGVAARASHGGGAPIVSPDDDVVALKERVTRLERRLADVDAKLGLLLAQRTSARPPASNRGVPDLGPRDLIIDEPSQEASLGARPGLSSMDLATRRSTYDDGAIEPEEIVDFSPGRDDGAPVVIKLHGAPEAAVLGDASSIHDEALAGPPPGSTVEESYAWSQARLKEGRHLEAIAALEEIVARSGAHTLADNAMYWIGWAHAQRGDHKLAVDVWQRLPMRFPKSAKVPDALFGMALSHEAMGEPAVAETLYEQLVSQYPRAEKVKEARSALRRLRPR